MPDNGPSIEQPFRDHDVLTLEEAAKYLRVPPDKLTRQAEEGRIPSQSVAGEWRFLKAALTQWLKWGGFDDRRMRPPFWFDHLVMEEWLQMLEQRLVDRLKPREATKPKRGSREAVMKYFGVFHDEENPEELLASLRRIRTEGD
jgi:excisionase family DNA binding protein